MMLHNLLIDAATTSGSSVALWWRDDAVTFEDLLDRVRRLAAAIRALSDVRDRVAVLSWNRPEVLELLYAVPAAGRVVVPLNARLTPGELAQQLAHTGAVVLVGEPELVSALAGALPPGIRTIKMGPELEAHVTSAAPLDTSAGRPDDVAWILFTSGTTGRPKGAMLTHRSLLAAVNAASDARPVEDGDRYLYPFPLFHVSAYNVMVQHRHAIPVALMRRFDPAEVVAVCRRHGINTMSLAPTMMQMLLDHPDLEPGDLDGLRTIGYGASGIPEPLLRRLLDTGIGASQGYGMTELSGNVAFLDPDAHIRGLDQPEMLRSAGRPAPGVEITIVDDDLRPVPEGVVGEIAVRSQQRMAGYWNAPEATAQTIVDGWLRTGDLGRIDAEGYLYVVDRKKDIVVTGGENVSAREVEDVVADHHAVRAAAVVGVSDPEWGEAVTAVVSAEPGADISLTDVASYCRAQLAGFKTPRHLIVVESLPVNANGKVDKVAIRQHAAEVIADRRARGETSGAAPSAG